MRRGAVVAGVMAIVAGWSVAVAGLGFTGHMIAHMVVVSIAAPLLAFGIAGTSWDPASRWPLLLAPLPMSMIEMLVVWGWHSPSARAFAGSSAAGLLLEQCMFLGGGLLLWCASLGTLNATSTSRRAAGVVALLATTMHMTLLGVLIAFAPRPLFGMAGFDCFGTAVAPLTDQQIGGVLMLLIGACSYLLGGLALMSRLLWSGRVGASRA
jgi:putative membrane protein